MRKLALFLALAVPAFGQGTPPSVSIGGSIGITGGLPLAGTITLSSMTDANYTLHSNEWWAGQLIVPSSLTLTATRTITAPSTGGQFYNSLCNHSTGGFAVTFNPGAISVPNGTACVSVVFDATTGNYVQVGSSGSSGYFTGTPTVAVTGTPTSGQVLTATSGSAATFQTPSPSGVTSLNSLTGAVTLAAGANTSITPSGNTLTIASTGGASSCPLSTATNVYLCNASTNVSSAGSTTTTTSGTFAVGTSGSVTSCSTFVAGNGVYIAGAGAAGVPYVGQVVSCTGTTLTVTPSTSTSVAATALVQHDESAALNAAIAALATAGGGVLNFPAGVFLVNGPLQDTGSAFTGTTNSGSVTVTVSSTSGLAVGNPVYGAGIQAGSLIITVGSGNITLSEPATATASGVIMHGGGAYAILPTPRYALGTSPSMVIKLQGATPIGSYAYTGGSQIITSANTGNLIGGYDVSGLYGGLTSVVLYIDSIQFLSTQANPCLVMINGQNLSTVDINNSNIASGAGGTAPTCTTSGGLLTPRFAADVKNEINRTTVVGFYRATQIGEHTHIGSLLSAEDFYELMVDDQLGVLAATSGAEGNSADYLWCQVCTHGISAGNTQATIQVQNADFEVPLLDVIYDPNNVLNATITGQVPYADGRSTSTPTNPVINGGSHIQFCNILTLVGCAGGGSTGTFPVTSANASITNANPGQILLNASAGVAVATTSTASILSAYNGCSTSTCYSTHISQNADGSQVGFNAFPSTFAGAGVSQPSTGVLYTNGAMTNGLSLDATAGSIRLSNNGTVNLTVAPSAITLGQNTTITSTANVPLTITSSATTNTVASVCNTSTGGKCWDVISEGQASGYPGTLDFFDGSVIAASLFDTKLILPTNSVYAFGATPTADTGLSRCTGAANCVALGNGTPSDSSGTLNVLNINAGGIISSPTNATIAGNRANVLGVYAWGSGSNDTGLSRDSAGVVDVGNGTAGDASGTVRAGKLGLGTSTFGTAALATIGANSTTDNNATVQINTNQSAETNETLVLQAQSGQSGDILAAENSSGTKLARIDAGGNIFVTSCSGCGSGYSLGGTPTVAAGAGAGTGGTASVTGLDGSHLLTVTAGTSPSISSTIVTVTFSATRGHMSYCVAYPADQLTAALGGSSLAPYMGSAGSTTYTLQAGTAGALTATNTYHWNVSCP